METAEAAKTVVDLGLGGVVVFILMKFIMPVLHRILYRLGDIGAALTLLTASLPDIKKRSKNEAERLHKEFTTELDEEK